MHPDVCASSGVVSPARDTVSFVQAMPSSFKSLRKPRFRACAINDAAVVRPVCASNCSGPGWGTTRCGRIAGRLAGHVTTTWVPQIQLLDDVGAHPFRGGCGGKRQRSALISGNVSAAVLSRDICRKSWPHFTDAMRFIDGELFQLSAFQQTYPTSVASPCCKQHPVAAMQAAPTRLCLLPGFGNVEFSMSLEFHRFCSAST